MRLYGLPLIGKKESTRYQQTPIDDGYLVVTNTSTETKAAQLKRIARDLKLDIKVKLTPKGGQKKMETTLFDGEQL